MLKLPKLSYCTIFEEGIITLEYIKTNKNYISLINGFILSYKGNCLLKDIISYVHNLSSELKQYCESNEHLLHCSKEKDKGMLGKIVEFSIFGNLPNSFSCPDLEYADIKVTHFIKLKNNGYNAKERLTLTNIGDPMHEDTITMFQNTLLLTDMPHYKKIQKGVIIIAKYELIESLQNKNIMGIILYDLNDIPQEDKDIIADDYNKIRECIINKCPSQKGQQYLHICRHSSKQYNTRAFAFTNKFLTKLVSFYLQIPLTNTGRSSYIHFTE